MKLRKNIAATTVVIMLSTAALPAFATQAVNEPGSWYSWLLSIFISDESNSRNIDGSGVGQPPPSQ
jgi:hypothetical protein